MPNLTQQHLDSPQLPTMDEQAQQFFANVQTTAAETTEEAIPSPIQLDTLKRYIAGDVSAPDAAEGLTRRITAAPDPWTMDQWLSGLWEFINDTAVAIPSKQDQIITLLSAIQKLPNLKVPKGTGQEYVNLAEGEQSWASLPGDFGNEWADPISCM
jgi:hypothetical protein